MVKGLSIGFTTLDADYADNAKVRQLKEVKLFEVSLVTFPMNEMAGVTAVKSFDHDRIRAALLDFKTSVLDALQTKAAPTKRMDGSPFGAEASTG